MNAALITEPFPMLSLSCACCTPPVRYQPSPRDNTALSLGSCIREVRPTGSMPVAKPSKQPWEIGFRQIVDPVNDEQPRRGGP